MANLLDSIRAACRDKATAWRLSRDLESGEAADLVKAGYLRAEEVVFDLMRREKGERVIHGLWGHISTPTMERLLPQMNAWAIVAMLQHAPSVPEVILLRLVRDERPSVLRAAEARMAKGRLNPDAANLLAQTRYSAACEAILNANPALLHDEETAHHALFLAAQAPATAMTQPFAAHLTLAELAQARPDSPAALRNRFLERHASNLCRVSLPKVLAQLQDYAETWDEATTKEAGLTFPQSLFGLQHYQSRPTCVVDVFRLGERGLSIAAAHFLGNVEQWPSNEAQHLLRHAPGAVSPEQAIHLAPQLHAQGLLAP